MKIKVLGCSGGISKNARTTCLLVDDDMLIDAGTGLGDLTLNELLNINHIFVTHSHLDHILGIPLLADALLGMRSKPVRIYALKQTIHDMKAHIFNWKIWPDFTVLPSIESPIIQFVEINVGDYVTIESRKILALPVTHSVPALGYALQSEKECLAFSGDTGPCKEFWNALNEIQNLTHVIVETTFTNSQENIAKISQHFSPFLLANDIQQLVHKPTIHITHLSPNDEDIIMGELKLAIKELNVKQLFRNETIEI
jgi:ribonuclease BN (tRNA processing enzyme)